MYGAALLCGFPVRFWTKFWIRAILPVVLLLLQLFTKEFARVELSIGDISFSANLYIVLIAIALFLFIYFILKKCFDLLCNLFRRDETERNAEMIRELAELIMASDHDFPSLFAKTRLVGDMAKLRTALALKRNLMGDREFALTGVACIDVRILRIKLRKLLQNGILTDAIELANSVIKNYASFLRLIKDELLEIAKMARREHMEFYFEPDRFKYDLPQKYITEYNISLKLVDFDLENDNAKKLKIIENINNEYPESIDVLCLLLDYVEQNNITTYDDKRIMQLIAETMKVNPNRKLAKYLLRLKRNDIFEQAKSMMSGISNNNIEKLWILLIIATSKGLNLQVKELISEILKKDKTNDVCEFFVEYHNLLQEAAEIANIIMRRKNGNKI